MHAKMQVFQVVNARFADSIVWENKSFVWKEHCQLCFSMKSKAATCKN